MKALRDNKIKSVGRYYFAAASSGSKDLLTLDEARALRDANISLFAVSENEPGKRKGDTDEDVYQRKLRYFSSTSNATTAITNAFNSAGQIGQPNNSAIYFAVDFDVRPPDVDTIVTYFQALNAYLSNDSRYAIGVYASGLVCQTLLSHNPPLVSYTWLTESLSFNGSSTYQSWNLKQFVPPGGNGLQVISSLGQENDIASSNNYGQFMIPNGY